MFKRAGEEKSNQSVLLHHFSTHLICSPKEITDEKLQAAEHTYLEHERIMLER